jgi:hypothetical protein
MLYVLNPAAAVRATAVAGFLKRGAALLGGLVALGLAAPAGAQTPGAGSAGNGPPLPDVTAVDSAGIDRVNGVRVGTDSVISIGAADHPSLEFSEGGGGYSGTPLGGFHYTDGNYPSFSDFLVLGSRAMSNAFPDGTGRNFPDGIIKGHGGVITQGDGTRWNMANTGAAKPGADAYLTTLVRPDGEILTYTYSGVPGGDIRGRLRSIRSSAGYQLNVEWDAVSSKFKKITLSNRRYAYCDPMTGACTGSYVWPTMSWAMDSSNNTAVTSANLRTVTYGPPQQSQAGPPVWEWSQRITSGAGIARTYFIRGSGWGQTPLFGRSGSSGSCPSPASVWKVQEPGATWNYTWQSGCEGNTSGTRTDPSGRERAGTAGPWSTS